MAEFERALIQERVKAVTCGAKSLVPVTKFYAPQTGLRLDRLRLPSVESPRFLEGCASHPASPQSCGTADKPSFPASFGPRYPSSESDSAS